MPTYEEKLAEVKNLNATLIGGVYVHYKRRSRYILTGFSLFKESGESENDERIVVHYTDRHFNPHTRFFDDFFGLVEHEELLVNRFELLSQIW